jgi:NAD(P)-dependent dehydrogenase (short-subunit alcohol dehydrogenase family)
LKARLPVYAGVKGAQRGFAHALAREWGPDGIRVNCHAPLAATPAMARAARFLLGDINVGRW